MSSLFASIAASAILAAPLAWSADARAQTDPARDASAGPPATVHVYVTSDEPDVHFGSAAAFGEPRSRRLSWPRGPSQHVRYEARLCTAPCEVDAPVDGNPYRVVGPSMRFSEPFVVPPSAQGVDVRVHAGALGWYVLGVTFTAIGGTFSGVGAGLLTAWAIAGAPAVRSHSAGALFPAGGALLTGGAIFLAFGLPLMLFNRTTVEIGPHRGASALRLTPDGLAF